MNQTTTGCAACYWYWDGQCTKANKCTGIDYRPVTGINEAYNPNIGINECGSSLPDDIVYNLPDDYTIPNLKVPEDMWYTKEATQIGVFYCLICGNEMPWYEGQNTEKVRICDECKQAIAWAKEKMKEQQDEIRE